MTKHTGLSRLAEAASPITHYPVKRRGERRHLLPNWDAIAWLEEETADDTRIVERINVYADGRWTGTQWTLAHGWSTAKQNGQYARPMYELFGLEASSTTMRIYTDPCPACLDFSRSWACEEHPEVPWDNEKKQWDRTSTDPYEPPLPSPGFTVRQADQGEYRRQAALYFQGIRPSDPNAGRPGYHYHFPTDRWVPDTDDALGDFRAGGEVGAGFFRGVEVTLPEISADERMAAEWERQNGIPLADVIAQMNRNWASELRRSFFRNATLEVNGETVDGVLSFSFEVEGDATRDS